METNKNNEPSNKKRYSNKQKLILSGALTLLIAGVSVGGVMLVKDAKLNETNKKLVGIQNKNKTLELQLKTTHDKLSKTINAKLKEIKENQKKEAKNYNTLKKSLKTETDKAIAFKELFNKFKTSTLKTNEEASKSLNSFIEQTEFNFIELEGNDFAQAIHTFFNKNKDEYKKAFNDFKKILIKQTFENSFIFELVANGRTFTGITATNLKSTQTSLLNQQIGVAKNKGKTLEDYKNEVKTEFLKSVKNNSSSETQYNKALEVWKQTDEGVFVRDPNELKVMFENAPEYKIAWVKYLSNIDDLKTNLKTLTNKLAAKLDKTEWSIPKLEELLKSSFASKDLSELNQAKLSSLKTELVTTLADKFKDYALKSDVTKEELTILLNDVFASKDLSELDQAKVDSLKKLLKNTFNKYALKSEITEQALKQSLKGVFASKDLSELDQAKLNSLKNELVTALINKFDAYALKGQITEAALTEILSGTFAKKELTSLNADGTLKDSVKTKIQDLINADKLMKQLKKIMLKTDGTTTPDTVKEVIYNIVKNKLIKNTFDSVVVELKRLDDVAQNKHLHNSTIDKNFFYRLAPTLFETPTQANEILSDLLSGSTAKPNTNALWKVGASNGWKVGTLNDFKAKKDQEYTKIIFYPSQLGWGVSYNANAKYTPAPAEKTDKTPAPAEATNTGENDESS